MATLKRKLSAALADRYSIERELGRSRTSTVFLARDTKLERLVAVKVLLPQLAGAVEAESFLREIQTTALLNHPHILTLLDSGKADDLLYFVTPYIEGESLRERLLWDRQLPPEDAVQICREVADAIAHAHAHGMVHRDIKPENILLSDGHATVADFGLARAITAGCDEFSPEGDPGMAVGTPAYMSPEQAAGSADVDGRSDVYSLGCVLYEMLAGQPPFTAPSAAELLDQQIHQEPTPIIDFRPTLAPEIVRVLDRALAKAPADRFAKASDFVAALPFPSDIRRAATAMSAGSGELPAANARVEPAPPRRSRLHFAAAAVAITALVGSSLWFGLTGSSLVHPTPVSERSVAVLPFANISDEPANAVFADGVHEDILTELSKFGSLDVVSRSSVMPYRTTDKKITVIGRELGVATILEGSVRRMGSQVRITAQLIDTHSDRHLWAETFDREVTDGNVFSVQSEVAARIAEALRGELVKTELSRAPAPGREDESDKRRGPAATGILLNPGS